MSKFIPSNTDVIKEKAVLVRLCRKKLARNRLDKEMSRKLTEDKSVTDAGALRVNKSIFTKESTQGFMDIYNLASKYFYRVTLPWDDKGYRLLSVKIFKEFTKKFKSFTAQYREVVNAFIDAIEAHIESAKAMLGDAFEAQDYTFLAPNGSVDRQFLLDQFELEVEFSTVQGGDDLRATLTEDDRAAIAASIEGRSLEKFAKSQEAVVHRIIDCVKDIHERLSVDENIFRDTLIPNLEDVLDIIPMLNISGDPTIDKLAADCRARLVKWDCQTLRDDVDKRKDISKAADDILKQAEGLI